MVEVTPSKSNNLQVQLAVNPHMGIVHQAMVDTSIGMDVTAGFIKDVYRTAIDSTAYKSMYENKKVVVVIDNAPAHNKAKQHIDELLEDEELQNLEILWLGPYSPMLNPCEGCFSVLKAKIKSKLRETQQELTHYRTQG